ncbi:MAG TPA: ATP-binding protein [Bacilli bacterium]
MLKRTIFILLLFMFVFIQCWFLYLMFRYPFMGIRLQLSSNQEWIVSELDRDGAGYRLGIRPGDVILKINDKDPFDHFSVKKWRQVEQTDSLTVSQAGQLLKLDLSNERGHDGQNVMIIFAEIICFYMAGLLLRKLKNSPSARHLALLFVVIGLAFTGLGASVRGDAVGKILIATTVMLTPTVFQHFLIVFLREKANINLGSSSLKYLYGFIAIISIILFNFFIPQTANLIYKISYFIAYPYFIGGILWNFGLLSYLFWKHRKENLYISVIIKTIWVTLFISFVPFVVLNILAQLLFKQISIGFLDFSWLILFFPLSFTYLMATNRLYDIPNVVRRILFTVMIAIIPSAVTVAIAAALLAPTISVDRLVILFIITVTLGTFVLYSLEYITTKLNKVMFPRKYYLQRALGKISRDLATISNFREIKEIVLVDIVNTLQVHGCAIVFQSAEELETIGIGEVDYGKIERHIKEGRKSCDCCTIFPINHHEEYSSFLIVSEKKAKTMLVKEELDWLNLIITYLSVSLENLYLIRKLTTKLHEFAAQAPDEQAAKEFLWFRKSMFEMQEKERQRIANDLHDTTMQDLLYLKRKLTALLEKYALTEEDQSELNKLTEYIEIINTNLRQSCFELYPHLLRTTGLVNSIEKTVEFENAAATCEIEFRVFNKSQIEKLDLDQKRHVFRIVQELISNAKKHAKAAKVAIELSAKDGTVKLKYRDDGIGFDQIPDPVPGKTGVGMLQMKSRVLDLHGQLDIHSKAGEGLKLKISFPLQASISA